MMALLNIILGPLLRLFGYGAAAAGGAAIASQRARAQQAEATVATQQRMQRAEEAGPRTRAEIINELRRGGL